MKPSNLCVRCRDPLPILAYGNKEHGKNTSSECFITLKNNVKDVNAFWNIKSRDGVFKDMNQNPGVYENVTHSSQEGVFKKGNSNLNMFVNPWIQSAFP